MQWIISTLAVLAVLLLRLAIPIGLTVLVIYVLHRMDVRWQEEAARSMAPTPGETLYRRTAKNCPLEKKAGRSEQEQAEQPCWQAHRLANGYLHEECMHCRVFRRAAVPAPVHS